MGKLEELDINMLIDEAHDRGSLRESMANLEVQPAQGTLILLLEAVDLVGEVWAPCYDGILRFNDPTTISSVPSISHRRR